MVDLNDARELASNLDYYDSEGGNAASEAADVIRDMATEIERLNYELAGAQAAADSLYQDNLDLIGSTGG